MHRVIKFRGKRLDNGEWVYGHYTEGAPKYHYITNSEGGVWQVDPESVGMYFQKDMNGDEMYEGDKVRFHYFYAAFGAGMGVTEGEHELTGVMQFDTLGWAVNAIAGEHWKGYTGYDDGEGESSVMQLLLMNETSIHENSFELLKP